LATAALCRQPEGGHLSANQPVMFAFKGHTHTPVLNGTTYARH
jgi:hypothetical protein